MLRREDKVKLVRPPGFGPSGPSRLLKDVRITHRLRITYACFLGGLHSGPCCAGRLIRYAHPAIKGAVGLWIPQNHIFISDKSGAYGRRRRARAASDRESEKYGRQSRIPILHLVILSHRCRHSLNEVVYFFIMRSKRAFDKVKLGGMRGRRLIRSGERRRSGRDCMRWRSCAWTVTPATLPLVRNISRPLGGLRVFAVRHDHKDAKTTKRGAPKCPAAPWRRLRSPG